MSPTERCEYEGLGGPCGLPAVGGGGNGLAWCNRHRPCACGFVLLAAGERFEDHGGGLMPGEPDRHTRAVCWDSRQVIDWSRSGVSR